MIVIFINNWIYSYKKSDDFPDNTLSMDQCLFFIQYHNVAGCIASVLFAMVIGKYTDKVEPKFTLAFAFILSALSGVSMYLTKPGHWTFYVFSPLIHVNAHTVLITIRSYSNRMFPMEIRSTLIGNISVGTSLCQLAIIQAYNMVYHSMGSTAPFLVSAIINVVLLISLVIMASCGFIETLAGFKKDKTKKVDKHRENQTN